MLRFMLGLACGVWISVLVTACATYPSRADGIEGNAAFHERAAFMLWDCNYERPVAFVRTDQLEDPDDLATVLEHEQSHIQDATSMGCEAWNLWRENEGNQVLTEVRAFCAELALRVKRGGDESFWREAYARNLLLYEWEEQELTLALARDLLEGCEL